MGNLRLTPASLFSPNCVPWVRNYARTVVGSRWYGGERQMRSRDPTTESDSRNSETQELVLRTVYVRRGVEGEGVTKFLTVRNLITTCIGGAYKNAPSGIELLVVRACLETTRGAVFGEKAGWRGATKENIPSGSSTEEQRS